MTPREFDVLRQVVQEKTTRQIAETLHLKPATIRSYLHSLFRKTRTSTRTTLVTWWKHYAEEIRNKQPDLNGEDVRDY